jgi:hypothetical protein
VVHQDWSRYVLGMKGALKRYRGEHRWELSPEPLQELVEVLGLWLTRGFDMEDIPPTSRLYTSRCAMLCLANLHGIRSLAESF